MKIKLFTSSEKSTFAYWWAHNRAYNKVAREWGVWKFKYLFHDIEKPFMKLFLPYEKVRKWHRTHNRHHISYPDKTRIDWMALALDWESGMCSKKDMPENCWSYAHTMMKKYPEYKELIEVNLLPILRAMKKNIPYNRDEK